MREGCANTYNKIEDTNGLRTLQSVKAQVYDSVYAKMNK